MHVCIHSPTVYPLAISGVGNAVTHLVRELDKLGVEISLVFYVDKRHFVDKKVLMELMDVSENVHLFPIFVPKLWRYRSQILGLSAKVLKTYLNIRPDLVHIHCFPSIFDGSFIIPYLTKIMRKPLVLTYHGSLTQEVSSVDNIWKTSLALSDWMRLSYFNLTKGLFNLTVTLSGAMHRRMIGEGFPGQRISVIPLGIDVEHFSSMPPKELEGDPALLFVGYTSWVKGSDLLLEAFEIVSREMPKAVLHIVGYCSDRFIEDVKARFFLDKVRLHGPVDPERVASYYKGADICVVTSRFENFGLTAIEALAAGRSLIATRVGGLPEKITNNVTGILVDTDAKDIARGIIGLWKNPSLRLTLSENSLKKAREFNWISVARQHVRIYGRLIQGSEHN